MTNGSDSGTAIGAELLSTTVKRVLLDRIMLGHYRPGERIIELQVAKELGVSQSPVREGLRDARRRSASSPSTRAAVHGSGCPPARSCPTSAWCAPRSTRSPPRSRPR